MFTRYVYPSLVFSVLVGAGCSLKSKSNTPTPPIDADATAQELTYYADIKPILDSKCVSCHQIGGIAPFVLSDAPSAVRKQKAIVSATQSRSMPPWLADNTCRRYKNDRSLSDDEIKKLAEWSSSGAKIGNLDTTPPTPVLDQGLSRVDRELSPAEAYKPKDQENDYRCFVMDWPETTTKFVTGFGVQPGHPEIVHHLIAFRVPPNQVDAVKALDDADIGSGYTCFGGPLGNNAALPQLAQWAPGSVGRDLPAGTGLRVDPGSKIVIQVHYNMDHGKAVADQSKILLKLENSVDKEAFTLPFTNPSWVRNHTMNIPAGESDVKQSFSAPLALYASLVTEGQIPSSSTLKIYSAALHMHLLGEKASLHVQRGDGSKSCLLDMPAWDFHWQGSYVFQDTVTVEPGDRLSLECHFNNSAAHQPFTDGIQGQPKDVNWGEGTEDEMCLGFLYVTRSGQ